MGGGEVEVQSVQLRYLSNDRFRMNCISLFCIHETDMRAMLNRKFHTTALFKPVKNARAIFTLVGKMRAHSSHFAIWKNAFRVLQGVGGTNAIFTRFEMRFR